MEVNMTKLMEEVTKSYEKILSICEEVEVNFKIMGLNYDLSFSIEVNAIVFNITRNGVMINMIIFKYCNYKVKSQREIVDHIMKCFFIHLSHWKNVINALQE